MSLKHLRKTLRNPELRLWISAVVVIIAFMYRLDIFSASEGTADAPCVPGEVLVNFDPGTSPSEIVSGLGMDASGLGRMYSIDELVTGMKISYKLSTDDEDGGGWFWYRGKEYEAIEDMSEDEIFGQVYSQMDAAEQNLHRTYRLDLPEGVVPQEAVKKLKKSSGVNYAEPNYLVKPVQDPGLGGPDPLLSHQWALDTIDAPEAWGLLAAGAPEVIVAVLDTGVDYEHYDLNGSMWTDGAGHGYDFHNSDNDPMDDNGHGTHCAGIIAAEKNNSLAIAGVAPNARIMALKILGANSGGNIADAANALYYAANNGAQIASNSWGCQVDSRTLRQAVNHVVNVKGMLMVAAAGNEGDASKQYPAAYENVISVAAINNSNQRAVFSNFGETVDIAAPGVGILSLAGSEGHIGDLTDPALDPEGYTSTASGTSMACPHVSGVAALILSEHPDYTPDQIKTLLKSTAYQLDTDEYIGQGIVNANNAMTVSEDAVMPPQITARIESPTYKEISGSRNIEIRGTATGTRYNVSYTTGSPYSADWQEIPPKVNGPVQNGVLATLDAGGLGYDSYYIKLTTQHSTSTVTDITRIYHTPDILAGWPRNAGSYLSGNPVCVDINNDGSNEILAVTLSGKVHLWKKNGEPLWSMQLHHEGEDPERAELYASSPAVGDMDGDGPMGREIVIIEDRDVPGEMVYIIDHLAGIRKRFNILDPLIYGNVHTTGSEDPVIIGDIDNNNTKEIIFCTFDIFAGETYVCVYDANGNPLPNWPLNMGTGSEKGSLALANFDVTTPQKELVLTMDMGATTDIHILDHQANTLHTWEDVASSGDTLLPTVGNIDMDENGAPEIVFSASSQVYVINNDGTRAPGWPVNTGVDNLSDEVVLANLDGIADPQLELIFTDKLTNIYAYNHDGTPFKAGQPIIATMVASPEFEEVWFSSIAVGDIDGIGGVDIVAGCPSDSAVYAYDPAGNSLTGFPKSTQEQFPYANIPVTPTITDVDKDGDTEIVARSYSGLVYIWDLAAPYNTNLMEWPQLRRDDQHTGMYDSEAAGAGAGMAFALSPIGPKTIRPGTDLTFPVEALNVPSGETISYYACTRGDVNYSGTVDVLDKAEINNKINHRTRAREDQGTPVPSTNPLWDRVMDLTGDNVISSADANSVDTWIAVEVPTMPGTDATMNVSSGVFTWTNTSGLTGGDVYHVMFVAQASGGTKATEVVTVTVEGQITPEEPEAEPEPEPELPALALSHIYPQTIRPGEDFSFTVSVVGASNPTHETVNYFAWTRGDVDHDRILSDLDRYAIHFEMTEDRANGDISPDSAFWNPEMNLNNSGNSENMITEEDELFVSTLISSGALTLPIGAGIPIIEDERGNFIGTEDEFVWPDTDGLTEGDEYHVMFVAETSGGRKATQVVTTTIGAPVSEDSIAIAVPAGPHTIIPGEDLTFTVQAANVPDGETVTYSVLTAGDLDHDGLLSNDDSDRVRRQLGLVNSQSIIRSHVLWDAEMNVDNRQESIESITEADAALIDTWVLSGAPVLPEDAEIDSATGEFTWTNTSGLLAGDIYHLTFLAVCSDMSSDAEIVTVTIGRAVPGAPEVPALTLDVTGSTAVRPGADLELTARADNIPSGETVVSYYAYTFGDLDQNRIYTTLDRGSIDYQLNKQSQETGVRAISPADLRWDPELNLDNTGDSENKITQDDADEVDRLIGSGEKIMPAYELKDNASGEFTWANTAGLVENEIYKITFVARTSGGKKATKTVTLTVGASEAPEAPEVPEEPEAPEVPEEPEVPEAPEVPDEELDVAAGATVTMSRIDDQTITELVPFTYPVQAVSSDDAVPISSYYINAAGSNFDGDTVLSAIDVTYVNLLPLPVRPTDSEWNAEMDMSDNNIINQGDIVLMERWIADEETTIPIGPPTDPSFPKIDNTGRFTWTPAEGQAGVYHITFAAKNADGNKDAEVVTITVRGASFDTPVLTIPDPKPKTIQELRPLTFTVSATMDPVYSICAGGNCDTDGNLGPGDILAANYYLRRNNGNIPEGSRDWDPRMNTNNNTEITSADVTIMETWLGTEEFIPLPAGAEIAPNSGVFTWTPTVGQAGTHHITFVATDSRQGRMDAEIVEIVVTAALEYSINVTSAHGGYTMRRISDTMPPEPPYYEGDVVEVRINPHQGYTFTGWTGDVPGGQDPSSRTIIVTMGTRDVALIANYNSAPRFTDRLGVQEGPEGQLLTFTVPIAEDADVPETDLVYSWSDNITGADFDPDTRVFTWTPDQTDGDPRHQDYPVTFTVSDGIGQDTQPVTIRINNADEYTLEVRTGHGTGTTTPIIPPPPYFQGADIAVTVTAQPAAGSDVIRWTFGDDGNGPIPPGVDPGQATISGLVMNADYILNANFNAPPVFGNLVVDEVNEGELIEISLPPAVSDPDNDPIVYLWSSDNGSIDPTEVNFDPIDGIFTWATDDDDSGTHPITFTATDTYNGVARKSINIVVNDVRTYNLDLNVEHGNGTLTAQPDPPYFEGADTVVTVTAAPANGSEFISFTEGTPVPGRPDQVTVIMSQARTVGATFNAPPVFGNLVVDPVDEGQEVVITLPPAVSDPENDPIVYSWQSDDNRIDPAEVGFDPIDGTFRWPTDENDSGTYPVTFIATDAYNAEARSSVSIVVNDIALYNLNLSVGRGSGTISDPLPPPPYFRNAPPVNVFISATPAEGFVFDRWDGLPNGMEPSTPEIDLEMNNDYNLVANFNVEAGTHSPSIDSLSPNSGNFDHDQQYTFTMELSDGDGADNIRTVEVYIGPVSTDSFLLHYNHQNKTFDIVDPNGTRHVGNADSNDILNGALGKVYCEPSDFNANGNNLTVTWVMSFNTDLSAGTYDVHVFVNDVDDRNSGMQDMGTIRIGIVPSNTPPVLSAVGPKSAEEGVLLSFPVSATDVDGDTLGYYVYVAGDFNHDLQVTGAGGDQGLLDAAFGKSEGEIGWNPECDLDNSDSSRGTIDDRDRAIFREQIGKSMPPFEEMNMGERSGVFNWTPAIGYAGQTNRFTILVGDGNGAYDAETILITVAESTNTPPTMAMIDWEMTVQEGMPLTFTATATDDGPSADLRYYVYAAGDLNHNGVCESGEDETIFNNAGRNRGDANWNPECDLVLKDGQITQGDRNFFAGCLRWGKRVPPDLMNSTTGVFQWTPAAGDAPDRFLYIAVVVDAQGARDAQAFVVDVTRTPAAPRIAALTKAGGDPKLRPEPGEEQISFTIGANELLDVTALTGSYNGLADHTVRRATGDTTVPAPTGFAMTQYGTNRGKFTWTPVSGNVNKTYQFTVVANNDIGEDTLTFSVEVEPAGSPPPPPPTPDPPAFRTMQKLGLPVPKNCPFSPDSGPYWSVSPARNDTEPNNAANTMNITIITDSYNDQATHGFRIAGDLDGDVVLELGGARNDDMVLFNAAFGSTPGDANWNPEADFNNNGVVNTADRTFLSSRADDDAILRSESGINALRFGEDPTAPCGAYLIWRPSRNAPTRTYYFTIVATDDYGKDAHTIAVYIPGGDTPDFPDGPGSGPGKITGIRHNGVVRSIPESPEQITFTHPEDATLEFDVLVGESEDPTYIRARLAGDWMNHNRIIDQDERDNFPSRNGGVATPYRPELDFDNNGAVDYDDYRFVEARYGENSIPRPRCKSVNKAGTFTWTPIGIADEPENDIRPFHSYYFTIIVYTRLEITDAYTIKVTLTEATGQDPHYPGRKLPSSSPQITGFTRMDNSEGTSGTFNPRPDYPGEIIFTFPKDRTLAFNVGTANFDGDLSYKVHLAGDQDGDGTIDSGELLHGNWYGWKNNGGYQPQLDFNNNRILDNDGDNDGDGDDFYIAYYSLAINSATGRKPSDFGIDSDGIFTWTPRPGFSSDHRGHLFTVIVTSTTGERDAYTFKVHVSN